MNSKRVVLVSGANRGIGLEIVRQLARLGLVVVLGARDQAKGQEAAEALREGGFVVAVVALDTQDQRSISEAVAEILRLHGRLDVLVNNAAILIDGPGGFQSTLADLKTETIRRTFETNVIGPVHLVQAVLPIMREAGYGRIVNLSSGAGQLADMGCGFPAYRMSKTALNALTRITAAEVRGTNIKVNSVCPGWVKTGMGGAQAERPVEKGAETPVWLATLPDDGPSGGFFRDKKQIAW